MKAADIPDETIYALVRSGVKFTSQIQSSLHATDQIPVKVTLAKLRQMVNKGRLDGCACGCRGDFTIPERYSVVAVPRKHGMSESCARPGRAWNDDGSGCPFDVD